MINIIKKILPFTIIIGVFSITLVMLGANITIVSAKTQQIGNYTWNYYYIDISQYLKNLEGTMNELRFKSMIPDMPVLPYNFNGSWDILKILKYIVNYFVIYLTNWVLYIIDLTLLLPTKILIWPIHVLLVLLGINTEGNTNITDVINFIYNINYPSIGYLA